MARKGVDLQLLVLLGLGGIGVWAVNKLTGWGSDAARGLRTFGEAIGSGLYDLFHKNQAGELLFYNVRFADSGKQHAVASGTVSQDGIFMWPQVTNARTGKVEYPSGAKRYRLLVDKNISFGVNKTAFPL